MTDIAELRSAQWAQGRAQPRTVTTAVIVAYDGAELQRAERIEELQLDDLADLRLALQEAAEEWFRGTVGIRCVAVVEELTDETEGG